MDYAETFASVAKTLSPFRMLLALTVIHDWDIEQVDGGTPFLNPILDEEVYRECMFKIKHEYATKVYM